MNGPLFVGHVDSPSSVECCSQCFNQKNLRVPHPSRDLTAPRVGNDASSNRTLSRNPHHPHLRSNTACPDADTARLRIHFGLI